ncbi:MAG: hypothetical protein ACN4E2_07490, partial [Nitrospinota bacterium]
GTILLIERQERGGNDSTFISFLSMNILLELYVIRSSLLPKLAVESGLVKANLSISEDHSL